MDEPEKYADDNASVVLISAIEHYSYCPRQCALIHLEQTFDDNLFTVRGHIVHERVDSGEEGMAAGVRVVRSIPLWSDRLGLQGKSDLVEFRPAGPYPVEYKSGRRHGRHADLQLCAQALCLEEMLGVEVLYGALFYHGGQRRVEVSVDEDLRQRTLAIVEDIRTMLESEELPEAANDSRCRDCSLKDACLPGIVGEPARLKQLQNDLFTPWAPGGQDA